ncbi:hypothetical protein RchiOBHm_Chr2g0164141 [Rosa chinensis]|uniref:Uncharacterized protein n=1 Tax=Rosa chinensis TaxID=74649 RepID=A0A2P6S3G5_ROSCH|nr:hypothetical protein RchiOBHm_Chr2g0164141 [Rosa chinensis]
MRAIIPHGCSEWSPFVEARIYLALWMDLLHVHHNLYLLLTESQASHLWNILLGKLRIRALSI